MASSPLRAAAGQQQSRLLDMQKKFQQKHLAAVGAAAGAAAGSSTAGRSVDSEPPVPPVRRVQQPSAVQRRAAGSGVGVGTGSGEGDSMVQVDVKGKRPTGRLNSKTATVMTKKPLANPVNGNTGGGGAQLGRGVTKKAAVNGGDSFAGGNAGKIAGPGANKLLLPPVVQPTVINALAAGADAASAVASVNAAMAAGVQKPVVRAGKLPPAAKPAIAPRRRPVATTPSPKVAAAGRQPAVHRTTPAAVKPAKQQPATNRGPPAAGMARCPLCARDFAADRLPKHEEVCRRTKERDRKRKVFDTSKKRLESVAAEAGVDVASFKKKSEKEDQRAAEKLQKKKDAWRRKHDALVRNVRAARAVQRHLAAGGSVRDLPPELDAAAQDPDDEVDSDLVKCPHCNRTFNEASAERHIPLCAERQRNAAARQQNKKR